MVAEFLQVLAADLMVYLLGRAGYTGGNMRSGEVAAGCTWGITTPRTWDNKDVLELFVLAGGIWSTELAAA